MFQLFLSICSRALMKYCKHEQHQNSLLHVLIQEPVKFDVTTARLYLIWSLYELINDLI